jgi:hypothetical protein
MTPVFNQMLESLINQSLKMIFLEPFVKKNNKKLSGRIKLKLSSVYDEISIEKINSNCFSSPYLYAYFNHLEESQHIDIQQFVTGYRKNIKNIKNNKFEVLTDSYGVAYIPNLGYFETNIINSTILIIL